MNDVPKPRHRWFAALYDHCDRVGESKTLALRKRLLDGLSGTVLEIGCGTGKNFEYYDWTLVDAVEATEPDPFMLKRAKEKLAGLGEAAQSRLSLMEAPAESLPFPDAHFDAVVSCLVLCTVADLPRSLSEMHRVLKPGGELRLLEHVAADGVWRRAQTAVQPVYGWISAGCRLDRRTEEAVRAAGFGLEVWEYTSFSPLHPAFIGMAWRAS